MYAAILDINHLHRDPDRSFGFKVVSISKVECPDRDTGVVKTDHPDLVLVFFNLNESAPAGCLNPTEAYLAQLAHCEYWKSLQPKQIDVTLHYPLCGQRVEFLADIDRFDAFCKDLRGETGTVTYVDDHNIWVQLDEHHPELDEWDNCIQWSTDGDSPMTPCRPGHAIMDFDRDVKYI